jgi:hypothetical protein
VTPRERADRARELRDAQIGYTRRGWATIELRSPIAAAIQATDAERRHATRPLNKGWPELAVDPSHSIDDRIERIVNVRSAYPVLGIGLVMGLQLDGHRYHVAIDEDEPDALSALAAHHGDIVTPTWRQAARRGSHYVYVLTERQALLVDLLHGRGGALHVRLPGVDVLGARRYIVGAPSTHRDGEHRYTVVDDRDPAELPEWLWCPIVAAATPTHSQHDDPDLDDDEIDKRWPYAQRLYRAERLCEAYPIARQGDRGWPTTMRLVGSIVTGLAVKRADAIEVVMRVHSPKCAPPWSLPEIEHMVDRAIAQPYRARGWMLTPSTGSTSLSTTIRGGQSGCSASTATPRYRAEIIGVDERPGRGCVWYRVLDGARVGQTHRRPLDWPLTARSTAIWAAHARAVGLDVITSPDAQLKGRVVCIEIADGTVGRIGHVYTADDNGNTDRAVATPPTDCPPLIVADASANDDDLDHPISTTGTTP